MKDIFDELLDHLEGAKKAATLENANFGYPKISKFDGLTLPVVWRNK